MNNSLPALHATLEPHTYADGRPFWIVVCPTCNVALNSGHHYRLAQRHNAVAMAHAHETLAHTDRGIGYVQPADEGDEGIWADDAEHDQDLTLGERLDRAALSQGLGQ